MYLHIAPIGRFIVLRWPGDEYDEHLATEAERLCLDADQDCSKTQVDYGFTINVNPDNESAFDVATLAGNILTTWRNIADYRATWWQTFTEQVAAIEGVSIV
jgi:hypothetical protein